MKRILTAGVVAAGLLGSATAAHAQDYSYEKGNDRQQMVGDMQESHYAAPVQQTAQPTTTTTYQNQTSYQPATVQPEAGDSFADFKGPYIGGDVGYSIGSYSVNNQSGPDGDVGLHGFNGGVFAGYGYAYDFSRFGGYGGIEVGYDWSNADGNLAGTSFQKRHNLLVTVRPGITVHKDALGYGIIGYSRAKFEGNGDEDNLNGLVLGAGTEFNTHTPLKIRLEYTYTNYQDANLRDANFDGSENDIKAGAVFRF